MRACVYMRKWVKPVYYAYSELSHHALHHTHTHTHTRTRKHSAGQKRRDDYPTLQQHLKADPSVAGFRPMLGRGLDAGVYVYVCVCVPRVQRIYVYACAC
jgi:hypothetical protein